MTAVIHATVGGHTVTVTAYDASGGKGTILSTGSTGFYVEENKVRRFKLTLSGVVASVALALDYPNVTVGSPAVINLNLTVADPDGNIILAPGTPFTVPITLTTSDPVDGKLSVTTIQSTPNEAPGKQTPRLTVAYNGANVRAIAFPRPAVGSRRERSRPQS